jgi:DNA-binding FadR family transcriptional regulator
MTSERSEDQIARGVVGYVATDVSYRAQSAGWTRGSPPRRLEGPVVIDRWVGSARSHPSDHRRSSRLDAVTAEVVGLIVAGEVVPGGVLPAESELARRLGVGRLTVREATRRLAADGVLDPQQGRGTFVRRVEAWSPLDPVLLAARAALLHEDLAAEIFEARRLVVVPAARLAAERRQAHHVRELERQLERMRAAADQGNGEQWAAAQSRFHEVVLEATGNPVVAALFDAIGAAVLDVCRHGAARRPWAVEYAAHERLLRAIAAGDTLEAEQAMADYLAAVEGTAAGARRAVGTTPTPRPRDRKRPTGARTRHDGRPDQACA